MKRLRRFKLALLATALVVVGSAGLSGCSEVGKGVEDQQINAPAAAVEQALDKRGRQLRVAIDEAYQLYKKERDSGVKPKDNFGDISDLILRFIPIGSTFDDAERILRAAGCYVGPRGATTLYGTDYKGRFDVQAGISHIEKMFFGRADLFIHLTPPKEGDYRVIVRVWASFATSTL